MKKPLPPALKVHSQAVKVAHAHLSKTVPGFAQQPPREQFRQTQAHVRATKGTK
jgi:hypothetical protein